jgi:hypothetical protein
MLIYTDLDKSRKWPNFCAIKSQKKGFYNDEEKIFREESSAAVFLNNNFWQK